MNFDLQRPRTAPRHGCESGASGARRRKLLAGQGLRVAIAARRNHAARVAQRRDPRGWRDGTGGDRGPTSTRKGPPRNSPQRRKRALGRVDILINAAGGSRPIDVNATREQWMEGAHAQLSCACASSPTRCCPACASVGGGRIVNLTGTSEPRVINAAFLRQGGGPTPGPRALSRRDRQRRRDDQQHPARARIRSEQISQALPHARGTSSAFAREEIPMGPLRRPPRKTRLRWRSFWPRRWRATSPGTVIPVDGGMYRFAF